ncbi:hypothetical protein [Olivibacter sitiensis]|uniref:hypothetical protein n=1 Tax=Olivibacter sitiensis TaxID=376470 RepID=UPI00040AFF30|nr:hypothetical protein [Olivibacter sitiensis]
MNKMIHTDNAKNILAVDDDVVGLAVGGSWLTDQIDEFSDLDLILVTKERISGDKNQMLAYARRFCNSVADKQRLDIRQFS